MTVFHCTTPKKLGKYRVTGAILPPVRYWTNEYSAKKWGKKTGRIIILEFEEPQRSYPLPVKGGAKWSDELVREFE